MGAIITWTPNSKRNPQRVAQHLVTEGQITLSGSYATGGDVLDAKLVGFDKFIGGMIDNVGSTLIDLLTQTDPSTIKLRCTVSNTGAEVANTTSLATVVANARFYGR